jgi:hypothetical protein
MAVYDLGDCIRYNIFLQGHPQYCYFVRKTKEDRDYNDLTILSTTYNYL